MCKIQSILSGIAALVLTHAAHATTYSVIGQIDQVDTTLGAEAVVTFTPANPQFSGSVDIDVNAPSIHGSFQFGDYQHTLTLPSVNTSLTLNIHNTALAFGDGSVTWNPDSLLLTYEGELIASGTPLQLSDCTGPSDACAGELDRGTGLTQFGFELTFTDASLSAGTFIGQGLQDVPNGVDTIYTFSGAISSVPLPAGVWLFMTALSGLGLMRSRQS